MRSSEVGPDRSRVVLHVGLTVLLLGTGLLPAVAQQAEATSRVQAPGIDEPCGPEGCFDDVPCIDGPCPRPGPCVEGACPELDNQPPCGIEEAGGLCVPRCIGDPISCAPDCALEGPMDCLPDGPVRLCKDPRADLTVPITGIVEGNGAGNQFQLFAGPGAPPEADGIPVPGFYEIFIRYRMVTNDINNGADGWSLGAEVDGAGESSASESWGRASIGCAKIGTVESQCTPDPCIAYQVHGGAAGTTGTEHCEWSTHWEQEVGLKVNLDGPEASYNFRWGGSETCGEETTFDSESLFDHKGTGDLLWPLT